MSDPVADLVQKYISKPLPELMLMFAASSQVLHSRGVSTATLKAALDAADGIVSAPSGDGR